MAEPGGGETAGQQPVKDRIKVRDRLKSGVAKTTTAAVVAASGVSFPAAPDIPQPPAISIQQKVVHTTEHKTITDAVPEIYARLFSKDREAGKLVVPSDVGKEYDKLNNLLKAGYRLDKPIKDVGVASDDDDRKVNGIRTGGLGVHSEKNYELALKRGTIFKRLFDQAFEDHGMQPPQVKVFGTEAVLGQEVTAGGKPIMNLDTKAIEADVKYLRKFAKQRNIPLGHLLDELNGIAGEPPPGNEKLHRVFKKLFKDKREVIITFDLTDEQGHVVTIVHKVNQPPIWFVPLGRLPEDEAGELPQSVLAEGSPWPDSPSYSRGKQVNTPYRSKIEASQGYSRVAKHQVQPRYYNDIKVNRHNKANQQNRSGFRPNTNRS